MRKIFCAIMIFLPLLPACHAVRRIPDADAPSAQSRISDERVEALAVLNAALREERAWPPALRLVDGMAVESASRMDVGPSAGISGADVPIAWEVTLVSDDGRRARVAVERDPAGPAAALLSPGRGAPMRIRALYVPIRILEQSGPDMPCTTILSMAASGMAPSPSSKADAGVAAFLLDADPLGRMPAVYDGEGAMLPVMSIGMEEIFSCAAFRLPPGAAIGGTAVVPKSDLLAALSGLSAAEQKRSDTPSRKVAGGDSDEKRKPGGSSIPESLSRLLPPAIPKGSSVERGILSMPLPGGNDDLRRFR